MKRLRTIDDLEADPENPREITEQAAKGLRTSIERYGDIGGITYNARTGELVSGHQRVRQLRELGAKLSQSKTGEAWIENPDTGERFHVRIVDWDRGTQREANLVANSPHIAGVFTRQLTELLPPLRETMTPDVFGALRLDELMTQREQSESATESGSEHDNPYTSKASGLIYEPTGPCPSLNELCDTTRYEQLLRDIDATPIADDVKVYLRHAAARHIVFSYKKAAEYYAHAALEIQKLFEASALVIIDTEQAIERGYMQLTATLEAIRLHDESQGSQDDDKQ